MAEQELLERPRYQDYPLGRKDPAYHEAIARWNAQERNIEYVPLESQIEQQLAEDANFMEVTELVGNIPALDDTNTHPTDGTAPVEYIGNPAYPVQENYSSFTTDPAPQGAGGFYAEQQMREQEIKEFEEDTLAENIRYAGLTDYERIQEDMHNPQDLIPLRQQNVDGLYAAFQAGQGKVFEQGFRASSSQDKIALYYKFYQDGTFDKQQYKEIVASQLQLDNPDMVYYYDDEDLFVTPKNPNQITGKSQGQIVLFPSDIPSESLMADSDGNFFNESISPAPLVAQDTGLTKDEKFTWTVGGTLAAVDPLDDDSTWVRDVRPVVQMMGRIVLGIATGGQSETWYTLYKLANGETLHGPDYANLLIAGLETAGVIAPPSTTIDPVTGVETATAGVGLGNLDYETTVGVVNYLGDGNIVSAALEYSGSDFNLLESTFEGLGINNETFGLDAEDWESILDKTQEAGFAGESMGDVFAQEVGEDYLSMGEDALKEIIPQGETPDWIDTIVDTTQEVGRQIDENVIQPLIAPVKEVAEGAEVILGEVGDFVEQNITSPIDTAIDTFGEEVVDPTLQALDDALPHGETPEGPDFGDAPDIDLPDIDLDLDLKIAQPKMTDTESLFEPELEEIYTNELYQLPKLFSDERLKGMFSRKYRI
jgi:hypothetical protein